MERYLVFAGLTFYPQGGWKDFKGSRAALDEAKDFAIEAVRGNDWCHIVDTETGEIVFDTNPD